jgi:uncharacterized repeat protein (TIGR03847 family)
MRWLDNRQYSGDEDREMADRTFDIHSTRITVEALGAPGQRVFLLQASQGDAIITLKLEKQQAAVLAVSIDRMLEDLAEQFPREIARSEEPLPSDLMLREPIEVLFAVGQMGMGYDRSEDALVLVLQELTAEEDRDSARVARIWATRGQMKALSRHIQEVVARGRPICALCGEPIDPQGHFCPKSNGRERAH